MPSESHTQYPFALIIAENGDPAAEIYRGLGISQFSPRA
jgi:hypothetical protein